MKKFAFFFQSTSRQSLSSRLQDYRAKYTVKPKPPDPSPRALSSPSSLSPSIVPPSLPSLPPFQPPPVAAPDWQCRMCGHRAATEPLFQAHLTTAHFREKIIRRIRPPFRCLICDYAPPSVLSEEERVEGETRDRCLFPQFFHNCLCWESRAEEGDGARAGLVDEPRAEAGQDQSHVCE